MTSARTLRWLLLATHVPPGGAGGGMIRYTVELAGALARHPGVELSVLAAAGSREWFADLVGSADRVHAVPGLPTPARSLLERTGVGVPALRTAHDVVHGTKHLLPRGGPGRKVLTVHDMLPLDRPRDFGLAKRTLIRGPYLASVREADALLCVSGATRDRLLAYVPEVRSRADVVHLATSTSLRTAPPQPQAGLAGRPFGLVVGDPSPRKNIPFLLEVWQRVTRERPDAVLAVVGPPGWGRSRHGDDLARLEETGQVVHLGHVPDSGLRWCYENAAVVLCPSLLEGFGLPAAEAASFAAPLVTSEDPALCEVSREAGRHLSTLDPDAWARAVLDALGSRASRPSAAAGMGARTWDDVADETVAAVRRDR